MFHRTLTTLFATATIVAPAAAQRTEVYQVTPRPDAPMMAWGNVTASRRAVIGVTVNLRP